MKRHGDCTACGARVTSNRVANELHRRFEKDLAAADVICFGRYINARGRAARTDLIGLRTALEKFDAAERAHLEAMSANQEHRRKLRERARQRKESAAAKAEEFRQAYLAKRRAKKAGQ